MPEIQDQTDRTRIALFSLDFDSTQPYEISRDRLLDDAASDKTIKYYIFKKYRAKNNRTECAKNKMICTKIAKNTAVEHQIQRVHTHTCLNTNTSKVWYVTAHTTITLKYYYLNQPSSRTAVWMCMSVAQPSYARHKCRNDYYDDSHKSKSHSISRTAAKSCHSLATRNKKFYRKWSKSFYICLSTQEYCVKLIAIKYREITVIFPVKIKFLRRHFMSVTNDS